MAIIKKQTQEIESSLLLESVEAIELPPAEVDETAVTLQFDSFAPFVAELIEELEIGTFAETVPVIKDGSTFAIHAETRTFWVKLWHKEDSEMTVVEHIRVLNCLPLTRRVKTLID